MNIEIDTTQVPGLANNVYVPTVTGGGTGVSNLPRPYPNTCPGCGRCKDCGRPYEQPYYPSPYQYPQIPYAPYSPPQYTWSGIPNQGLQGVADSGGTAGKAAPYITCINTANS